MTNQTIEAAIKKLKIDKRGYLRGQNKCIDEIHRAHLKKVDNDLMDIRIFVAKISTANTSKVALAMVDNFIYNKQIK